MDDLKARLVTAIGAMRRGEFASAAALLAALTRDHPGSREAWHLYGRALVACRRHDEAGPALRRAAEIEPRSLPMLLEAGGVLLGARRGEDAEGVFRAALALDAKAEPAWSGLVLALAAQDRHEDAVAAALDAVGACPGRAEPLARAALLLERLNRLEEAYPLAERAVAADGSHALALFALGTILFRRTEHEPARAMLERALGASRAAIDRQAVLRALAQTLDALDRPDEAFARFVECKPDPAGADAEARAIQDGFLRFLEANRRDLDEWTIASWRTAPTETIGTPPIFVVGFPRSGTTMFERMLGAHGRFVTTDEHPALARVRLALEDEVGSIDAVPKRLSTLDEAARTRLRGVYFAEVERAVRGQDPIGKRLVDRHPINLAHLAIARRLFPGCPVIVCLRDPRDAVLSGFMRLSRNPWAGLWFCSLESAAGYYAALMNVWLHFRRVLGPPWLEVRYEDLVTRPQEQSRRVTEFLGEAWTPEMLAFAGKAVGAAVRSPSYQQVSQAMYTHAVGRWRRYARHFGPALDTLRPFVEAFGYDAE